MNVIDSDRMFVTKTKVITAHVPLPLADKIDDLARRLERSKAWVVKQALTAWVDQEALTDVDQGHVIDHPSVQAWAESLDTDTPLPLPRYRVKWTGKALPT